MLPRKAIIAVVVVSFLLLGYKSLSEWQADKAPNLLLGFAVVGAVNAFRELKEITQIA